MSWFSRRVTVPVSGPLDEEGIPHKQMAIASIAPVLPAPPSQAGIGGQAGWAPLPVSSPWEQNGMFAGRLLNQFPANLPGVQLHSGREWGNSHWYTPTAQPTQNGGLTQTTRPNNLPSAQRYGSIFSGPSGPISAQKQTADVIAAQVRQSGMKALGWARALTPGYVDGSGS